MVQHSVLLQPLKTKGWIYEKGSLEDDLFPFSFLGLLFQIPAVHVGLDGMCPKSFQSVDRKKSEKQRKIDDINDI